MMTSCSRRTSTDRRRALLFVVLAFVIAPISGARADGVDSATQAKADVLFEKGQAHFQAGEYQAAIQLFQDAYGLVNDPVYLFNIAQSFRKTLDCVAASDYYNRYLAQAASGDPKTAAKVQGWLRELEPCVEQRRQEHEAVEHAAQIEREEKAREEAERQRQLAAANHPIVREIDRGHGWRVGGVAAASVGVAGVALGVVYSVIGGNKATQATNLVAMTHDFTDPAYISLNRDGYNANTIATIGYVAGGVLALGGAAMYVYGRMDVERVVVTPAPGGATVGITGSF